MTIRTARPFSIGGYLVIVFAFSWPFQLAFVVLGLDGLTPLTQYHRHGVFIALEEAATR